MLLFLRSFKGLATIISVVTKYSKGENCGAGGMKTFWKFFTILTVRYSLAVSD